MVRDIWQEVYKLRGEIAKLEKQLAKQYVKVSPHPQLRVGTIKSIEDKAGNPVYEIQERNVDAEKNNAFVDVRTMPDDGGYSENQTVAFFIDDLGERFILPGGSKLITVQDLGENIAKEVTINEMGDISTPENSESLSYVVAEPVAHFHENTPPTKTGRIYPALKCLKEDGVNKYYIVFVEGHGNVAKIFAASANIEEASTLTFTVSVDGQGNVISIGLTAG